MSEAKSKKYSADIKEREELEKLNEMTRARLAKFERELWDRVAEAEMLRRQQERKYEAAVKLVLSVVLALAMVLALLTLGYTGAIAWWMAVSGGFAVTAVGTFKAGCYWILTKGGSRK